MNKTICILSAAALSMLLAAPVQVFAQSIEDAADSTVYMGYTDQTKAKVSAAVSTVSGVELEKSPSVQISQALEGALSGLTTFENSSQLGKASVSFRSRGIGSTNNTSPLIIVDGVIANYGNYDFITAQEIESVTLLKDASALAIYGMQGANGVLVITTKRGRHDALNVSVKVDESMQSQETRPYRYSSYEYATMRRQAWANDGSVGVAPFSEDQIAKFKAGNDPLYPNNDWYSYYVKPFSQLQRAGINVSGGGRNATYFSNLNVSRQGSIFNTDPAQTKYNAAPNDFTVNFRTKVDIDITDNVSAFVNVSGTLQFDHLAGSNLNDNTIYNSIFNLPPTMVGPKNADGNITTMENVAYPTYGLLNASGFTSDVVLYSSSHLGVQYKFNEALKGLKLYAAVAFQTANNRYNYSYQDYARYYYDYSDQAYIKRGSNIQTNITNSTSSTYGYNIGYYAGAQYKHDFGKCNSLEADLYSYFLEDRRSYVNPEVPACGMPYYRHNVGLNVNYSFKNTYMLRADLGISGSDEFARAHRYTPVPALSAAWLISNEPFMSNAKLVSMLKLRASAGFMANDQFSMGDYRFLYMDYTNVRGSEFIRGNSELEPEKVFEANLGVDLELMKELSMTVDGFYSKTDNMLISDNSSIPAYQGMPLEYFAKTNNGRMHNMGFEASLQYDHRIDSDWSFRVGGTLAFTKNVVDYEGELALPGGTGGYAYTHRVEGYPYGQQWGYLIDRSNGSGYITTDDELEKYSKMYSQGGIGTARKGDFIYKDLNGDGLVDKRDQSPIGNGSLPTNCFTMNGALTWRNFELTLLFQGVTGYYGGTGYYTDTSAYGIYSDIHRYAWTAEKASAGQTIKYPALAYSTSSVSEVDNDFSIADRSYLRLKNVTLTYTLPKKVSDFAKMSAAKVYLNCQNAFTFSRMAGRDIDPETSSIYYLQPYRIFNIGFKLEF